MITLDYILSKMNKFNSMRKSQNQAILDATKLQPNIIDSSRAITDLADSSVSNAQSKQRKLE